MGTPPTPEAPLPTKAGVSCCPVARLTVAANLCHHRPGCHCWDFLFFITGTLHFVSAVLLSQAPFLILESMCECVFVCFIPPWPKWQLGLPPGVAITNLTKQGETLCFPKEIVVIIRGETTTYQV